MQTAFIEKTKIIEKGKHWWNKDKKETYFEKVEIIGTRTGVSMEEEYIECLVRNKDGKEFSILSQGLFFKPEKE